MMMVIIIMIAIKKVGDISALQALSHSYYMEYTLCSATIIRASENNNLLVDMLRQNQSKVAQEQNIFALFCLHVHATRTEHPLPVRTV